MVAGLAERHGDEHPPARPEDAGELAQRVDTGRRRILGCEPVPGVVGSDVLEGRDEEHLVDARVGERQRPHVGDEPLHALDVALGEVDPDELDARPEERDEIRRLRERVADLQHAPVGDEPREHPRDLDDALVRPRRRLQPPEPLAARSGAEPERDRVVELAHAIRLVRRRQLVEERRPRQRPLGELRQRPLARLVVGRSPQQLAKGALDEVGVGDPYASSPARTRGSIRGQPYA